MAREKKIQLIMPGHECREISSDGWTLPHGILSIATYLKQFAPSLDVEVFYGGITPHEEILKRLGGDVVGITANIGSYRNALEIARRAKEKGSVVVFGGPHASVLCNEIIFNRGPSSSDYCVDAVVVGDGEEAFYRIVDSGVSQRVVSAEPLDRNALPIPDRSFLDMRKSFEAYLRKFSGVTPYTRATSMFTQHGCTSKWCAFCGRINRKWRPRSPEKFWDEATYLAATYNADFIFVMDDTFPMVPEHVEAIAKLKPSGVKIAFRFFARADQIDGAMISLLKDIGCEELYVGMESGDQRMLDAMNKGLTVEDNLRAVELASRHGIRLCVSWVLGAPGETGETLENTVKLAKKICARGCVVSNLASIWIPLPGSSSFKLLLEHPATKGKYSGRDILDLWEMSEDWVSIACGVSCEHIRQEVIPQILELAPIKDIKGEPLENCQRAADMRRFRTQSPERAFLNGPAHAPAVDRNARIKK